MEKNEVQVASVRKAFDLLDILIFEDVDHDGVRLSDLAALTGQNPNTLHAILKTMIKCGYVSQNSKQRYVIGKRCRQIGLVNQLKITPQTAEVLDSQLKLLFDNTGMSVSFYVLSNGERINYSNMPQSRPTRVDYSMLDEKAIYQYPSGKVLVSYCSERDLTRIIRKNGYPESVWGNAADREGLDGLIRTLRQDGWSKRNNEQTKESSYSLPVFYPDGSLLGALGVYTSWEKHPNLNESELKRQMANCANAITKKLSLSR